MSQSDYLLQNQGFVSARGDINAIVDSILTHNSGSTPPAVTAPSSDWYDESTGYMNYRNTTDTDWVKKFLINGNGLIRTNAGDPNGSITGGYTHELLLDVTNNVLYRYTGSGTVWSQTHSIIATYAGDPNGNVTGVYTNELLIDTTNDALYRYTGTGMVWNKIGGTAGSGFDSNVYVHTGNGHGSVNTKIRRYATVKTNTGTDITYADSSTLGASFTINTTGKYLCVMQETVGASPYQSGISKNSNQLTTAITSITGESIVSYRLFLGTGDNPSSIVLSLDLTAGDVIRPHSGTSLSSNTTVYLSSFHMARIG